AFQLGFVAMTEAIVTVIRAVSLVVIAIILAVAANTMAMSARERRREYATLRALGFWPYAPALAIVYESLMLTGVAGLLGIALIYPAADFFAGKVGTLFPVFQVSPQTVWLALAANLVVGLAAAVAPAWGCYRMRITDGLNSVG
ncbi:MAG: ABC transporter permease, partial [Gammaproteobacteria bacterium]